MSVPTLSSLLPPPNTCADRINDFNRGITQKRTKKDDADYGVLIGLVRGGLVAGQGRIQQELFRMLGSFQAFRNQPAPKNWNFVALLAQAPAALADFNTLFASVWKCVRLSTLLSERRRELRTAYDFTQRTILIEPKGRIVTVSKALMMLTGCTPAYDESVLKCLKQIYGGHSWLSPGQWTCDQFIEVLSLIAADVDSWERIHGRPLISLEPIRPIGIVVDKVLFRQ